MGVLGMSFYRCVILISWQMSYILFLPIPPPHHCPHGPHQCPCAGPLGSRSFEPRSPNLTSGHPNTLLLLHLHLIRCFKNAMPKSALSPPLTSGHSHPPILSHHYTVYGVPTKQHQTTPLPPATIQPRIRKMLQQSQIQKLWMPLQLPLVRWLAITRLHTIYTNAT